MNIPGIIITISSREASQVPEGSYEANVWVQSCIAATDSTVTHTMMLPACWHLSTNPSPSPLDMVSVRSLFSVHLSLAPSWKKALYFLHRVCVGSLWRVRLPLPPSCKELPISCPSPARMFCLTSYKSNGINWPQTETSETRTSNKPSVVFQIVLSGVWYLVTATEGWLTHSVSGIAMSFCC